MRVELQSLASSMIISAKIRMGLFEAEPIFAHHGLQRSGTNYLLAALLSANIPVQNAVDGRRHSPRHKHFRLQDNKVTIPEFIRAEYSNDINIGSLSEFNKLCNYRTDTIHLVCRRPLSSWLASIINWGFRCGWISKDSELENLVEIFSLEYHSYYSKWQQLAQGEEESVVFVDELNLEVLSNKISSQKHKNIIKFSNQSGVTVAMSPSNRTTHYTRNDIENILKQEGLKKND